jgi:predicted unusual protein kinase regulating ubiquinone biosynthesis (AarF/ABC1/UbiB family)
MLASPNKTDLEGTTMGISLQPRHLKRYKDVTLLLLKHGRSDLVQQAGLDELLKDEKIGAEQSVPAVAAELATDLEKMGPTFIKLGQLLSTRADLIPPAYADALSRLQDNVEPFSFAQVEEIVVGELGVRISKAFSNFESIPQAAASIGQAHRAVLRDGREVIVKVQRPGIREQIIEDLEALIEAAEFLDNHTEMGRRYGFQDVIEEFRKSLLRELDYRQEANNLITLNHNLKDFPAIVVPLPIEGYTTSRVLTMEYIRGKKVTALGPLTKLEIDGDVLANELFRAYLKQILVDGFVHADPHPGNVFLTERNQIALLDLGMVARVAPGLQERLLQLLLAISEDRADDAAKIALHIGRSRDQADEMKFRHEIANIISQHHNASLKQIQIGRMVLEVTRVCGESGIRLPIEMTMLGKTLLNLDQVGHALSPEFDPNAAIRRNAAALMQQRISGSLSVGNLFSGMLEMKDFVQRLPNRVNKILDRVADNDLEVKVDAIDEKLLMEGLQKIANRITLGLILAALIIGASKLMDVPTSFRILGYPGLAIIFFLAAAGGGLILVFNILFGDLKSDKK